MYEINRSALLSAIARSEKQISQVQREAGLNGNTIYLLLNGKTNKARISTLGKIARVLEVEITDLIKKEA